MLSPALLRLLQGGGCHHWLRDRLLADFWASSIPALCLPEGMCQAVLGAGHGGAGSRGAGASVLSSSPVLSVATQVRKHKDPTAAAWPIQSRACRGSGVPGQPLCPSVHGSEKCWKSWHLSFHVVCLQVLVLGAAASAATAGLPRAEEDLQHLRGECWTMKAPSEPWCCWHDEMAGSMGAAPRDRLCILASSPGHVSSRMRHWCGQCSPWGSNSPRVWIFSSQLLRHQAVGKCQPRL